jgi:hypothetical protein
MTYQNRVTPFGTIIATPARGAFMGNRGILHNERQQIVRPYKSKAWIICRLAFKGRQRSIMSPGTYTELFFLDEATALAAGHRPCFECRRERALAFCEAWMAAGPHPEGNGRVSAREIDAVLHQERLTPARYAKDQNKQMYTAALDSLPNGAFIEDEGIAYLVWDGHLFPWTADGYLAPQPRPVKQQVIVLTPPSTVGALAQGYVPAVPGINNLQD